MSTASTTKQTAGAFDIRNIIGLVIGIFGLILLIVGLFFSPGDELAKSGGIRANLIAGIVMLVVDAVFFGWSRLRPIVLPAEAHSTRPPSSEHQGGES